jgi:hypothetical protein
LTTTAAPAPIKPQPFPGGPTYDDLLDSDAVVMSFNADESTHSAAFTAGKGHSDSKPNGTFTVNTKTQNYDVDQGLIIWPTEMSDRDGIFGRLYPISSGRSFDDALLGARRYITSDFDNRSHHKYALLQAKDGSFQLGMLGWGRTPKSKTAVGEPTQTTKTFTPAEWRERDRFLGLRFKQWSDKPTTTDQYDNLVETKFTAAHPWVKAVVTANGFFDLRDGSAGINDAPTIADPTKPGDHV